MKIAVAGGTGSIGRHITEIIRQADGTPVVLSRSTGFDLTAENPPGLDEALRDVSTIIDVTNLVTLSTKKSVSFFETVTRNLLAAGERAGVAHFAALSIIGIDRVKLNYYAGKLRQEELVMSGPLPFSILRAAQFYEFTEVALRGQPGPFVLVPKMSCQPIAAREVADALVELAAGAPAGRVPDLAGPDRRTMPDMVRRLLRARGDHRAVIPFRIPGAAGRAMASGALLPEGPGPRGTVTFDRWLETDARVS